MTRNALAALARVHTRPTSSRAILRARLTFAVITTAAGLLLVAPLAGGGR